jgi:transcriptional regulator with XRE-family HTH domain
MKLGNRIKELRESQGLLQRELSADLEIDTPMFSKIERGERRAKREQVQKIAALLKVDSQELLTLWLTDQVLEVVANEDQALQALKIAIKDIKTNKKD